MGRRDDNAEVAEHWIYLARIGALLFFAGAAIALPARGQAFATVFVGVAIVAFGARTALRSADWINAETFCLRTIQDGGATPRILDMTSIRKPAASGCRQRK